MRSIPLRTREGITIAKTVLDDAAFERFGHFRWHLQISDTKRYAYRRTGTGMRVGLHRASCQLDGRKVTIGRFATEDEAGSAASAFRAEHMPFSADARAA